jgi:hypothetical protein
MEDFSDVGLGDNIKRPFTERVCKGVYWIHLDKKKLFVSFIVLLADSAQIITRR